MKNRFAFHLRITMFFVGVCVPTLVFAEPAGQVLFVNGTVQIISPSGAVKPLFKGGVVNEGDSIITASASSAQIRMKDGGFIAVRPDSRMRFDRFVYKGKQDGQERSFFSLLKGGFRAVTGAIGALNKETYRINTPAATIGIRGTDHEVFVIEAPKASEQKGVALGAVEGIPLWNNLLLASSSGSAFNFTMMDVTPVDVSPLDAPDTRRLLLAEASGVSPGSMAAMFNGAPPGAYSKVNVGQTTMTTSQGTTIVNPNQMGFAANMNAIPQIQPVNANIFTSSAPPNKTMAVATREKSNNAQNQNNEQSDKPSNNQQAGNSQNGNKGGGNAAGGGGSGQGQPSGSAPGNANNSSPNNGGGAPTGGMPSAPVPQSPAVMPPSVVGDANALRNIDPVAVVGVPMAALPVMPVVPIAPLPALTALPPPPPPPLPMTMTDTSGNILDPFLQTITSSTGSVTTVTQGASNLSGGGTLFSPSSDVAYLFNHIVGEGFTSSNWGGMRSWMAAPSEVFWVAGGSASNGALVNYISRSIGGAGNISTSAISGATPTSLNALSFATTGIQWGSWSGASTTITNTNSFMLGGSGGGGGSSSNWMYGPSAYWDSLNMGWMGTMTYALDGIYVPVSMNSGLKGTLNSATITAVFGSTNVSVTTSLSITMPGSENWVASTATLLGNTHDTNMFRASTSSSNLTISHGIVNATTCPSCSGNLAIGFTGQNFVGAIIEYSLYDPNGSRDVQGNAALLGTPGTAITTGGSAITPTTTIVAQGGNNMNQWSGTITAGTVPTSLGGGTNTVTISGCATCTATAASSAVTSGTGIYFGNWSSGTYMNSSSSTTAIPSYWITGPEAGPLYLSQALLGSATYTFDSGAVWGSLSGAFGAGTVLNSSALTVNFTQQLVAIALYFTTPVDGATVRSWTATTSSPLQGNQGIGSTAFRASTYGGNGGGLLSVTSTGGTTPMAYSGDISGQLTGAGLTGGILSFNLTAYGASSVVLDSAQGVAAFSGTAQNTAVSHRYVSISRTDDLGVAPVLGFYANNTTRVTQDAAGNLTKFDTQNVTTGNGATTTLNINTATVADLGTDPVTGISWGRWAGGSITETDRITGAIKTIAQTGSLHWIAEAATTTAVTLPITGTYTYTKIGGTSPTDQMGNVGTLNSATLTADFSAQTVNMGVNVTVANATMDASAANVPIIQQSVFYASTQEPAASTSHLNVTCTGTCNGTAHGGTIVGKFVGAGATGAAMTYALQNGLSTNAATNPVISGVVAFKR